MGGAPERSEIEVGIGIGEAARMVGVSPSTLRAWERLGLVHPIRTTEGHRRFTLADIAALRQVRRLRDQGGVTPAVTALIAAPSVPIDGDVGAAPGEWRVRLRGLRRRAGLSLRAVSAAVGLSPSFISAIERGRANPSVAALQRLTTAYGTSIVEVMGGTDQPPRSLVRVDERAVYDATGGVTMEQLNFGPHRMELHLFTVAPGAGSGAPYQHEGEEFIFLLRGRLAVWLDRVECHRLQPGDTLYFASTRLHEWRNDGSEPAVFLGVNTPPTF